MADDVVVLRDGDVVAGGKAAEMTEDDLVRWMVGRQISQLYPDRQSAHHPKPLLQVESVTQPEFVSNISFQVCEGEIFGISGLMGSGRTELARMLFGLETFQSGTIRVAGESIPNPTPQKCMRAGMALVTEDRQDEGLLMTEAIRPNIALASLSDYASTSLRILDRTGLASAADQSAKKAGIVAEDPLRKLVCNLSGGNQQKVVLAKWLMRRPRVLILDEPTRGVDVGAKHEVYRTISELAAAGMAVVMISSELEELIGMCDRIAVMNRGEITAEFQRDEFDSQRIMQAAVWTREEVPT